MNCYTPSTLALWMLAASVSVGCGRSMNGSLATGPFAPAGTATQAGAPPLVPLGPVNGATRVPPPATGSSQTGNSYLGTTTAASPMPMAAENLAAGPSPGFGPAIPGTAIPQASFAPPQPAFRTGSGGMNVIDLTHQLATTPPPAPLQPEYNVSANQPVGSGLAPSTMSVAQTSAPLVAQPGVLRPIDTPSNAVPVPQYRGYNEAMVIGSGVKPMGATPVVQPVSGVRNSADPWQTVRSPGSDAQSSSPPSGPVNGASINQATRSDLQWRSPTTAR